MHAVISAIISAATDPNGATAPTGVNNTSGAPGGGLWWWWVAIAIVIVALIVMFNRRRPMRPFDKMQEDQLKERFAHGEITKQEFDDGMRRLHHA